MSDAFDLLLLNGTVVTEKGTLQTHVGVRGGRIVDLAAPAGAPAAERFDATGLHVLPGAIDTQCHFREPGLTHKEDIGSGSRAAALGGITGFFEMPNTQPNTDSRERLEWKVQRARETSFTDFAFYVGATKDNAAELKTLEQLPGCAGVKMFLGSSTGTLLVDDPEVVKQVLRSGTRRIACHSEDEARLKERKALTEGKTAAVHHVWRDEECAVRSTARLLAAARETGRRVHVLHVTSAGEIPLLAAHRDVATFEVTPQHLTLWAPDCYERLGTLAQMNPPIREKHHLEALWQAVQSGLVDVIGSDHAPHTLEEKAKPYPQSPSGMPGVQTLLPLMLNHMNAGRLSLERVVDLTALGPARIFGLQNKGSLRVGRDADFSIVDVKAQKTITNAWSQSRCGWTPFDGLAVTGWPIATIVRGQVVMRDGAVQGAPPGQPFSFN